MRLSIIDYKQYILKYIYLVSWTHQDVIGDFAEG